MERKISRRHPRSTKTSRKAKTIPGRGRRVRRALVSSRSQKALAAASGLTIKARPSTLEQQFSVPEAYGQDRVVLLARDPQCLFAYWEIQPKTERAAQGQLLPQEVPGLQTILRVYAIKDSGTRSEENLRLQDIGLSGMAKSWYVPVPDPSSAYRVEIGILTATGRFVPMAASNRVVTPPSAASEEVDPQWTPDAQLFNRFLKEISFSNPAGSSVSSSSPQAPLPEADSAKNQKGMLPFRCHVETDLVLYGTTEPRARVFVQGQPVPVRKDGSFSLRIALPEGTRTVHVEAISADGKQTATAAPVIVRTAVVTGDEKPSTSKSRRFARNDRKAALE